MTRGARVALFINSLQRGGAETQFLRVAHALRAAGHEVRVFTLLPANDFADRLDGIEVRLLAARVGPATPARAVRELRAWRPDVVLNFLFQATLVGRLAALTARTPVVVSSMRNERLESWLRTELFRRSTVTDSVVVANSHRTGEVLVANGTVPARKLRVIANGLDVPVPAPGARARVRAELGIADDTVLFVGAGRLSGQKDWATLVQAADRYAGPPAVWAIAGTGADEPVLRERIAAGPGDRVRLLGLRDDVPDLLAASDALVLSSTYEGMPNVVLEAMALGRPCVTTRVGACAELLDDPTEPGGLLVPPADPDALAAAMATLAARPAGDRERMGRRNARVVAQRYALEVADRAWVALIDELIDEPDAGVRAGVRARRSAWRAVGRAG